MNRLTILRAMLVSAGRIGFVALWFGAVMLVYASFGRAADGLVQAGVFALAIACIKVTTGFISDPVDLATMGHVPALLRTEPARAYGMLRAGLVLRLAAVLAVAVPVALLAPLIARWAVPLQGGAAIVRWTALAIAGDALFRAMLVVQQAREHFTTFMLLEGALQVGRIAAIGALWAGGAIRVDSIMACYAGVSIAAALAGACLMPRALLTARGSWTAEVAGLLGYLRWMVPAMMLASVNERLDVFMVYTTQGSGSAGLYGGVLTIALIPDILGGCLSTVLQPRISRLYSAGAFSAAFRRFLLVSVPLCVAGLGTALLLAGLVLPMVLGARYSPAVPVFEWLLAGTLVWLAITPLPMTLVAVLAPGRTLAVTVLQSVTMLTGGLILLPVSGPLGMAQAMFVTRIAASLALVGMARSLVAAPRAALPGAA